MISFNDYLLMGLAMGIVFQTFLIRQHEKRADFYQNMVEGLQAQRANLLQKIAKQELSRHQ